MINHKPLDQICDRTDKFFCPADPNDRLNDLIIVGFFVMKLRLFRDQFFYDISKIFRKCLRTLERVYLLAARLLTSIRRYS